MMDSLLLVITTLNFVSQHYNTSPTDRYVRDSGRHPDDLKDIGLYKIASSDWQVTPFLMARYPTHCTLLLLFRSQLKSL
jgi:hypothetical protein